MTEAGARAETGTWAGAGSGAGAGEGAGEGAEVGARAGALTKHCNVRVRERNSSSVQGWGRERGSDRDRFVSF